jgi:hypothetical protein
MIADDAMQICIVPIWPRNTLMGRNRGNASYLSVGSKNLIHCQISLRQLLWIIMPKDGLLGFQNKILVI